MENSGGPGYRFHRQYDLLLIVLATGYFKLFLDKLVAVNEKIFAQDNKEKRLEVAFAVMLKGHNIHLPVNN